MQNVTLGDLSQWRRYPTVPFLRGGAKPSPAFYSNEERQMYEQICAWKIRMRLPLLLACYKASPEDLSRLGGAFFAFITILGGVRQMPAAYGVKRWEPKVRAQYAETVRLLDACIGDLWKLWSVALTCYRKRTGKTSAQAQGDFYRAAVGHLGRTPESVDKQWHFLAWSSARRRAVLEQVKSGIREADAKIEAAKPKFMRRPKTERPISRLWRPRSRFVRTWRSRRWTVATPA